MLTKYCNGCEVEKSVDDFYTKKIGGKEYRFSRCKKCRLTYDRERRKNYVRDPEKERANNLRVQEKHRKQRASGEERDKFIVLDSRASDRKHGRENDLDREFVKDLIHNPCFWCEGVDTMMTVDRLDNEQGHLKGNVVPACIRCNLVRRDMPREAWSFVSAGMKRAREAGAFGDWLTKRPGN